MAPLPWSGFWTWSEMDQSVTSFPAATKHVDAEGWTNANGSFSGALATVTKDSAIVYSHVKNGYGNTRPQVAAALSTASGRTYDPSRVRVNLMAVQSAGELSLAVPVVPVDASGAFTVAGVSAVTVPLSNRWVASSAL